MDPSDPTSAWIDTIYYDMGNGSSYEVDYASWHDDEPNLLNYNKNDINVRRYTSGGLMDNGMEKIYRVKYAGGRIEWYDEYGRLGEIQGKYQNADGNNKISFFYYNDESDSVSYGNIQKIRDSLGREIVFGYARTDGSANQYLTTQVNFPDGSYKQYFATRPKSGTSFAESAGVYLLDEIRDQSGLVAEIEYSRDQLQYSPDERNGLNKVNKVANITSITYRAGNKSQYSYGTKTVNISEAGTRVMKRVSMRYEQDSTLPTAQQTQMKIQGYTYDGDYTGYSGGYSDPNELPASYSYSTTMCEGMTNHDLEIKRIFNNKHLEISAAYSRVYGNNQRTLFYTDTVEYDSYDCPVIKTRTAGNVVSIEKFENDSKGNVTAYWSAKAGGNKTNTEYKTTYTYDSRYNMLLTKSYKKDAGTTIVEENTLSSDGKSIAMKTVRKTTWSKQKLPISTTSMGM